MAGFFYFFDDRQFLVGDKLNHQFLEKLGIRYLGDIRKVPADAEVSDASEGPGGKPGHVLYVRSSEGGPAATRYDPLTQEWIDRGDFWLGWDKANSPTAADLVRDDRHLGYTLEDEFGNEWSIPVVRSHEDKSMLPMNLMFDKNGEMKESCKPRHEHVWGLAKDALDYLLIVGGVKEQDLIERFPESRVVKMAADFLGINYRVGTAELSALTMAGRAVLDRPFVTSVLIAATEYNKLSQHADYLKKKRQATDAFIKSLPSATPGRAA